MIKSGDLTNRAGDPSSGDPKGSEHVQRDLRRVKGQPEPEADNGLATRLQVARDLVPFRDGDLHCGHCWGQGRDAAIRAIEGPPEQ